MKEFKKFTIAFLYSILFLWVTEAHAWVYVETPAPYSELPNPIECRIQSPSMGYDRVDCFAYGAMSGRFTVLTAEDDGTDIQASEFSSALHLRCRDTYCRDIDTDSYLGRFAIADQPYTVVEVPFGYYVMADPQTGDPVAYQKGTGPMADTFSRPWIASEMGEYPMGQAYQGQGGMAQVSQNQRWNETYELWCSPKLDECAGVGGMALPREELPNHYPIVDVPTENGDDYYCSLETCHRKSDDKVIGLNPHYHMWD